MGCSSCGIGPSSVKRSSAKPTKQSVVVRSPAKIISNTTSKKMSVPTRSPARTFNTVGE